MKNKFQNILLPLLYSLTITGYAFSAMVANVLPLPNRELSIVVRLIGVLICVYLLLLSLGRKNSFIPSPAYWLCAVFFMVLYLARFFNDVWFERITFINSFDSTVFLFATVLLPFVAFSSVTALPRNNRCLKFVFYILLVTALGHLIFGLDMLRSGLIVQGRVAALAFNPISLSLTGCQLVAICFFIYGTRIKNQFYSFSVEIGLVTGAALAILGGSRGPIIALMASLFVLGIATPSRKLKFGLIVGGPLLLVVSYISAIVLSEAFGLATFDRFSGMFDIDSVSSRSVYQRYDLIAWGWQSFRENLFFGVHVYEQFLGTYYHNLLIEILAATGIAGFCAFAFLFIKSIRGALKVVRTVPSLLWLVLLYVQAIVMALSSGTLWGSAILMSLMGVLAAVGSLQFGRDRKIHWAR